MAILKLVMAFLFSFSQMVNPFIAIAFHGGADSYGDKWSADDEFTKEYCATVQKDPDKDFVILNLADIQLSPDKVFSEVGEYTEKLIDSLIKETNPDLITLTGDNSSSMVGYKRLASILDSYEIPWAPVMGNHDGDNGNETMECWDSKLLMNSEYCLFKVGPEDMGFGNYVINICEGDKIVHSLIMMDTHSDAGDTDAGKVNYGKNEDGSDKIGYDHLWANQIEWYKWVVNGLKSIAGEDIETTVFMHIPCLEYRTARDLYTVKVVDENGNAVLDKNDRPSWVPADGVEGFGSLGEDICSPEGNNGFFDTAVELGSTKNMVVGHDHVNCLCINYKGIGLNYGLKSGKGSYWDGEKLGGTTITIGSGETELNHIYYPE